MKRFLVGLTLVVIAALTLVGCNVAKSSTACAPYPSCMTVNSFQYQEVGGILAGTGSVTFDPTGVVSDGTNVVIDIGSTSGLYYSALVGGGQAQGGTVNFAIGGAFNGCLPTNIWVTAVVGAHSIAQTGIVMGVCGAEHGPVKQIQVRPVAAPKEE